VLRDAAAQLRSIAVRVDCDGQHPLTHALALARNDRTWKGGYAENIRGALAHQERILADVAEAFRNAANWLDQLAAERDAASPGPLLPGACPPGPP